MASKRATKIIMQCKQSFDALNECEIYSMAEAKKQTEFNAVYFSASNEFEKGCLMKHFLNVFDF